MNEVKKTEDGVILCNQKNCELPATHTYVWSDEWVCSCLIHAQKALSLADVLGFKVPATTMRQTTIKEMLGDKS